MLKNLTVEQHATVLAARAGSRSLAALGRSLIHAVAMHGLGSEAVKIKEGQALALIGVLNRAVGSLAGQANARAARAALPALKGTLEGLTSEVSKLSRQAEFARYRAAAGEADWPRLDDLVLVGRGYPNTPEEAFKALRRLADATGRSQAMIFQEGIRHEGVLKVSPGQSQIDAIERWRAFKLPPTEAPLSDLSSRSNALRHRVGARNQEALFQALIADANSRPARSETELMAYLEGLKWADVHDAGLAKLANREEIRTLAVNYARSAPTIMERDERIVTDADTVRVAVDFMRYRVESDGVIKGTEAWWREAIALVEEQFLGISKGKAR